MTELNDAISKIEALARESRLKESELAASLQTLSDSLVEVCDGVNVYASGSNCTLYECPPAGEYTYGHMAFSEDGFSIAFRTSDDDLSDAQVPNPDGPTYKVKYLFQDCRADWLQKLVKGGSLQSLLTQLAEHLQSYAADFAGALSTVQQVAANPSSAIASSFERAAERLGYNRVVADWKKATLEIYSDPESAITLACTLLETVCKHILGDLGEQLPSDQSIKPLVRETAKALGLDPAGQADSDLRGLCSGLATVAQSVGALRTKFGDAHGKDSQYVALQTSQARLAVNAAGNIATFLMERWQSSKVEEKKA